MKNASVYGVLCLFLVMLACKKELKPFVPGPEATPQLDAFPVEKKLFGFNTGSTFYFIRPDATTQDISGHWLDSLQPQSFRFPGGRDANYYHHYAQAYGFKEDEFKSGHSEQEAFTELWEEIEPKENNYPPGINVKIPFALMAGR
ncbi:MAG: hypothetical protein JNJ57_14090, partial [Saprospiraceae bacterium]|nr:hypothetical protein [Saprospiraceae bacterium]